MCWFPVAQAFVCLFVVSVFPTQQTSPNKCALPSYKLTWCTLFINNPTHQLTRYGISKLMNMLMRNT